MKRALLFLFCALISTQMFSESSSPYGTATSFAKTDVASTTFNNDIEDISSDLRKKYLVEKITWYDNETNHKEAYYEYDNNNRLERRIIHSTYFEQGRVKYDTIVDNYEYTGGNLTKISHKDVYISYTYDLEYDNVGRLITSKYGNNIMHFCYRGGKMDSIWFDNDPERYTILKYDEHGNIVKEIMRVPEMDDIWGETPTGDYVFIEYEYQYDDKTRPFFNIDNAFVYDPIFGQETTTPNHIRMLSTNNLIKYSRSSWHYTYNEEGLPIELRSRFEGVTPVNDPKYVFTYRKIKKTESLADLFPTLWGLQRTSCDEWFDGCEENKSYLFAPKEITEINGKQYLKCGGVFLREEDSKVLIYSFPYEKDLVLYDYTLEVGDTLQNLGIDIYSFPELEYAAVVDYIAYEDYDVETDEFIIKKEPLGSKRVTEVSTITLLDGKEYKRWLFGNDWENGNYYVEGIGNVGGSFGGDYINIANPYALPTCYMGEHLVCVSKNNKLLYQMDPVKMDELGAECLCDYDRGPRKDNAKDGQIGGRPTPTQWNQLELDLREMENGTTILRAETFSYTLEDISQQVNNKTYFQLARQSTKDTATTKSVVGALHFGKDEDNRVYFLRDGVEYVLYDFTAEIGDTVEIFAGINNYPQETTYTHVVTGKDTLENGACRMMLEVVFPDETSSVENAQKVWLAGLGSIDGIVHNAASRATKARSSDTQTSVMLCAWREDNCLYMTNHPDYDTFGCVYNQDPTAVKDISTSQSSYQKIIREGQFLILHNGKTYSVMGIEL